MGSKRRDKDNAVSDATAFRLSVVLEIRLPFDVPSRKTQRTK